MKKSANKSVKSMSDFGTIFDRADAKTKAALQALFWQLREEQATKKEEVA